MYLKELTDPRDALQKTRRKDIERYARENNLDYIEDGMPQLLMVKLLRQNGIHSIPAPQHRLGFAEPAHTPLADPGTSVVKASPEDLLEREWEKPQAVGRNAYDGWTIPKLRKEVKARGLKQTRNDNMQSLKEKLHAQDASQRSQ